MSQGLFTVSVLRLVRGPRSTAGGRFKAREEIGVRGPGRACPGLDPGIATLERSGMAQTTPRDLL